jgi:hypothetical protein
VGSVGVWVRAVERVLWRRKAMAVEGRCGWDGPRRTQLYRRMGIFTAA